MGPLFVRPSVTVPYHQRSLSSIMKAASQTDVDCAADEIDLAVWLSTLSDREYQACARGHLAAGGFRDGDTFGSVNIESVGGHLLIQHYYATQAAPKHVVMHSRASRAYILHLVPVTIEVIWTQWVEARGDRGATFHCRVDTHMPTFLAAIARLALLPLFLRWHIEEETPLFAQDIVRKVGEGRFRHAGSSVQVPVCR